MTKAKDETPEQRENRLIKARKQAGKTREQAMKEKYRDKILEDLNKEAEAEEVPEPVNPPAPAPVVPVVPENVVPVVPQPKKPRKKAATKIIVEQDSDDSDYFEDKPNIIFVKRVAKKKETPPPPAPAPVNVTAPVIAPYIPRSEPTVPPKPPPMTPQQRLLVERYNNMARGNFLPMSRPR